MIRRAAVGWPQADGLSVLKGRGQLSHRGGRAVAHAGSKHGKTGHECCGFGEVEGDGCQGAGVREAHATTASLLGMDRHPAEAEPLDVAA